jgi:hypothetical protein
MRMSRIPIIGVLFIVNVRAKQEALIQLIMTVMFATLPIWFGGIIAAIDNFFTVKDGERSVCEFISMYSCSLFSSISNGELLMYSAALLGPTLYLGFDSLRDKERTPFPWLRSQLLVAIFITLFATVIFFGARDKGYTGEPIFIWGTIVLYALALIILLPAMAYEHHKRFIVPTEYQQKEQEKFMEGYRDHRG